MRQQAWAGAGPHLIPWITNIARVVKLLQVDDHNESFNQTFKQFTQPAVFHQTSKEVKMQKWQWQWQLQLDCSESLNTEGSRIRVTTHDVTENSMQALNSSDCIKR